MLSSPVSTGCQRLRFPTVCSKVPFRMNMVVSIYSRAHQNFHDSSNYHVGSNYGEMSIVNHGVCVEQNYCSDFHVVSSVDLEVVKTFF